MTELLSIAIWKGTRFVQVVVGMLWIIILGYHGFGVSRVCRSSNRAIRGTIYLRSFHSVFQGKTRWDPTVDNCIFYRMDQLLSNIIVLLVCDTTLLVVMFVGVLKSRMESKLWRLLYRQVCPTAYMPSERD